MPSEQHPVDRLRRSVEAVPENIYPPELVPLRRRYIEGVAAFPAARGLYAPCGWDHQVPPPFPVGGLMLVGHHLDDEDVYERRRRDGAAHGDPCPGAAKMRFWSMLYALLDEAGVPRDRLFVTNVYPALTRDGPTGRVRSNPRWDNACRRLLTEQITTMRPSAVAALGRPAQEVVGALLGVAWDAVPGADTTSIDGASVPVLAIRHPSASQSRAARTETAMLLRQVAPPA